MLNKTIIRTIIVASILLPGICYGQLKVHSFAEAEILQATTQRNLVVFIYTDWCRYCGIMKNTVFRNESIAKSLNENFHFIYLNAEDTRDINFNGRRFSYKPNGSGTGVHELAVALGTINDKMRYPAIVILNPRHEIIFQYSGFLDSKVLGVLLSTR